MKNLTIAVWLLFSLSFSTGFASKLEVISFIDRPIKIIVDHRIVSEYSQVVQLKLNPGIHQLKIISYHRRSRHSRLEYRGTITIPRHSKVVAKLTRFRNLIISVHRKHHSQNSHYDFYDDGSGAYYTGIRDFNYLLRELDNIAFESDKLRIAKQAVRTNGVTARQVLRIINQFSFESTKLKFAKFAYRYCTDKHDYFIVNRGFSFSSSIRQLDHYIVNHY